MPFPTMLETLLEKINIGIDSYLMNSTYSAHIDIKDSQSYNPDSIDRKILPILDINDIPYVKENGIHLDVIVKGMMQKYASEYQKSQERELFDYTFNRSELDNQIIKSMNNRYTTGLVAFYAISTVGVMLGLGNIIRSDYGSSFIPITSCVIAAGLLLIEHWDQDLLEDC